MTKMNLPRIDQVVDLPQDPAFPTGFASSPFGPCGLVKLAGIESVRQFALTYRWDTVDQRKSAVGWARHLVSGWALAATIREMSDKLDSVQKNNINYSCNWANDIPGGSDTFTEVAFDTSTAPLTTITGGSFPANFAEGEAGNQGQVTSEKNQYDAKLLAFNSLIRDVRMGAYLMGGAVA